MKAALSSRKGTHSLLHGRIPRPPLYLWFLGSLLLLSIVSTISLLFQNPRQGALETKPVPVSHRRELKATTLPITQRQSQQIRQQQQQQQQLRRLKCHRVQTWDEYQACTQGRFLSCQPPTTIWDSWKTVQRCLHGRTVPPQHLNHTQIYLIGERHSGTKFVLEQLHQCFADHVPGVILVKRDFIRHKHFFQRPTLQSLKDKVVISVVRNPYDWVAAMRRKPYHMPNHIKGFERPPNDQDNDDRNVTYKSNQYDSFPLTNKSGNETSTTAERRRTGRSTSTSLPQPIPLDWFDFVTRPWTTNRSRLDLDIIRNKNTTKAVCAMGFSFKEVVPCQMDPPNSTFGVASADHLDLMRGHTPVYELRRDKSGRPFQNILQLRAEKIRNLVLEVGSLQLGGFLTVRYEDLLQQGTEQLLRQVARILLGNSDKNDEDQRITSMLQACRVHKPQPKRLFSRPIPADFRQHLRHHIDWEMEKVIGYFPTDQYGQSAAATTRSRS